MQRLTDRVRIVTSFSQKADQDNLTKLRENQDFIQELNSQCKKLCKENARLQNEIQEFEISRQQVTNAQPDYRRE